MRVSIYVDALFFRLKHRYINVGKKMLDLLSVINYNRYTGKGRGNMPKNQRGRPFAENPRSIRLDIRVTKEELRILDEYCERKGVKRPQGLRDGLKALEKM